MLSVPLEADRQTRIVTSTKTVLILPKRFPGSVTGLQRNGAERGPLESPRVQSALEVEVGGSEAERRVKGLAPLVKELESEQYFRELALRRWSTVLAKLPESALKGPDYELLKDGQRVALAEVKLVERLPMTPEHGWLPDPSSPGAFTLNRIDNAPSRVGRKLHEAWKQLRAFSEPKILVYVNDDSDVDRMDLHEAINGFMVYGNDETGRIVNTVSKRIAAGDIREEKYRIDLYVWVDRHRDLRPGALTFPFGVTEPVIDTSDPVSFACTSDVGHDLAHRFFGCPETPKPTVPGV